MPTTRRRSAVPQAAFPTALRSDALRHAAKAHDYTERGEWLAYYNTLTRPWHASTAWGGTPPKAALPCTGHHKGDAKMDHTADATTTVAPLSPPRLVVPGKPRATLDALYAAIPLPRKVVRFQEAFACPNVREQRETEARKG